MLILLRRPNDYKAWIKSAAALAGAAIAVIIYGRPVPRPSPVFWLGFAHGIAATLLTASILFCARAMMLWREQRWANCHNRR